MDESRSGRPLADDPSFLASLTDLDRGLAGASQDDFPLDADRFSAPTPRTRVQRPARIPPARSLAAPSPAPPIAISQPTPMADGAAAPAPRRSLLDLFPPAPDLREPPPGPMLGTTPGPALPGLGKARRPTPWDLLPVDARATPATSLPYETFYGLSEKPFSLSTDPKFLYHSTAHDRTAQELLTSIRKRDTVVVITGPFGIGKTTLCRTIIEQLDRRTLTCLLVDPFLSVEDLLETLLIDFGALSRGDLARGAHPSLQQLRATLQSFLVSLESLQASAVVLIDEAQNLPVSVLDELRALAVASEGHQVLHVVLVGEAALLSVLKRPDLRPLDEHVAVRSELGPLAVDELPGYVMVRLAVAGSSARVDFADAALARVHEITRGVPRMVNLLCDRAMVRGQEACASTIDVALVNVAAADLNLSAPVVATSRTFRFGLAGAAFVLLMLLGAAAAAWVFRDDVRRTVAYWQQVPPAPAAPAR